MKNIKNLVVAVACCVGMTLNACQLLMTNDGATGLRVRDKNAPDVSMYIAPGATKLTMDLTGDDSTLEFFVESKRKGVYNKKYTLSILVCAINKIAVSLKNIFPTFIIIEMFTVDIGDN